MAPPSASSFTALAGAFAQALWLVPLGPLRAECRVGTLVTELDTRGFSDFVNKNDKVAVDFYNPGDAQWPTWNQELQSALRQVRDLGSNVPIAKVNVVAEKELMKKYVPNGPFPQLMWFQHGEPTSYHRSLRKAKNIMDFVLALDRDPIQVYEKEQDVRTSVNRAVWFQVPKGSEAYKVLQVVSKKHMDTTEFAFKDSQLNEIRWVAEDKPESELYTGELNVETLERWIRGHLTRSEPLPEPQEGDSLPVVGANFEDVVLREDKDVFLLIYAPWCGFSRKFIPTWESLARRAAAVPHLVVAKMDGDRNGSPYPEDFSWNAYPTVFFVKAGTRKPVVFHGNRTETRLLEFARQHSSRTVSAELDAAVEGAPVTVDDNPEWEL